MLKVIAFGLAVGAGIQAWRSFPPSQPATADGVAFVFIVGVVCAYLGGLWNGRGRRGAVAVASAHAEATATSVATNTVQLVVMPGHGPGAVAGGVTMPSDAAPWLAGTTARPQLDPSDLEGMDLAELLEHEPLEDR